MKRRHEQARAGLCLVAAASYTVYELGRPSVGLKVPTAVLKHGENQEASSSRAKQTSSVHPSYEVPNRPVPIAEETDAAVSPEAPYHESMWVKVLLPATVIPVPLLILQSFVFMRLEHRSASRATGKTGLK